MSIRQLKISKSITSRDSISLGKYLQEISKLKMLLPADEAELCRRTREGDPAALEQLVKANLRFVVSVAKQYQGQGLSLGDMVNEGNIGLMNAARKFDETRGFRFISFAVWWIRQEIVRAITQQSELIRMPANKCILRGRIRKMNALLEQQLDRPPTSEELAEGLQLPEEDIIDIMGSGEKVVSLDSPLSEEDESGGVLDIIENPEAEKADHGLCHSDSLKTELSRHLSLLNNRQKETICYFFGIEGHVSLSIEEISRKFQLTPERVRQIKEKALETLRKGCNQQLLKSF